MDDSSKRAGGLRWGDDLLTGDRVRLSALEEEDAQALRGWYRDAEFMRLYDAQLAKPQSLAALQQRIREGAESDRELFLAIRGLADDDLVGLAGFDGILWHIGVAGMSLAIDPQRWGQGLGSEAARLLLRYGFDELNLHRIQLTVFAYNQRALRLYTGLGFREEGRYREFILRDGQRYDMVLMGLLAHEWRERASIASDPNVG